MKKTLLIFCMLLSGIAFNNVIAQINYQWVKAIHAGSPGEDIGKSTVVDDLGSIYVTGRFEASLSDPADFNPFGTNGPVNLLNKGKSCFVAKYSADGNCEWAGSIGPTITFGGGAVGMSIAVDAAHNVYVLGVFEGTVDFDPNTSSVHPLTSQNLGQDCFFAKYNSSGIFQWVKAFGGSSEEWGTGITVDGSDGVYVTGFFNSPTASFYGESGSPSNQQWDSTGGQNNIFLAKYNSSGVCQWANSFGGTGDDRAMDIAIGGNDYWVTITGYFQNTVDFGEGTTRTALGSKDAFFSKYATGNGSLGYPFHILGQNGSVASGTSVTMDNSSIYIGGVFKDFIKFTDTLGGPVLKTLGSIGKQDIFFTKYEISHELDFANSIKCGSATDSAFVSDIAIDPSGFIYLTGAFNGSAQFNPAGGDILNSSGNLDIFFAKYGDSLVGEVWAKSMGSIRKDVGYGIAVDNSENVYLTGSFGDTVNFDPNGTANRIGSDGANIFDGADIFIAKYAQGTSTIQGIVKSNNIGVNNEKVNLYTQISGDGNAAMHLVGTVNTDINGFYSFPFLPTADYLVLAFVEDNSSYHLNFNAIPTYNGIGYFTFWDQAPPITTAPNQIFYADINMVQSAVLPPGDAKIGGRVIGENGFDRTVTPMPSIPIGLEGDPGSVIIAHTETDAEGYYSFDNLSTDSCYKIYVNIPGLLIQNSHNYHACPITSLDSIMTLDFFVDSSSIDTLSRLTSAIFQIASSKTKILLYPNPNKGFTTIEFTMAESNLVHIEAYNLIGEKVAELVNEQKQAGIVKLGFNAADRGLKAGVYLLKLKIGDETITKKIIQIE